MGLFGGMFGGPAPDAAEAERLLVSGRAALWRRDNAAAEKDLARSARGHKRPAVPRAYLSLSRRMRSDFGGAVQDARAAVRLDDECLEARAALAAALLSDKKLVEAGLAYNEMTRRAAYDRDGHALKLLLVALFAEVIANAEEDADGLRLNFELTPATRCAIRTLDGRARLGLEEAAKAENSTVLEISIGAAYYFSEFLGAARNEWARAATAFPDSEGNASIRLSLKLMSEAAPAA